MNSSYIENMYIIYIYVGFVFTFLNLVYLSCLFHNLKTSIMNINSYMYSHVLYMYSHDKEFFDSMG